MLKDVRGEHTRMHRLKFIDRVIRLHSNETQGPVTLLKVASFENAQISDSFIFREVGLDLQDYTKRHIDSRTRHSFTAVYMHLDCDSTPSLIAQRNFRLVRRLCTMLRLPDPLLYVMSPRSQGPSSCLDTLQQRHFQVMEDLDLWKRHLAFQDARSFNQCVQLTVEHQGRASYAGPTHTISKRTLEEAFHQVDVEYFTRLRDERAGLMREVDRAGRECQKARDAASVAEQTLADITLRHNSLLQHLNIRDNTELRDVVHQFRGLNDDIDSFSLEVAQIIPSDYFERYPDCTNCHYPDGLRQSLSQFNRPLLLESCTGMPMASRSFLELLAASAICWSLSAHIFWPFYPLSPRDPVASVRLETLAAVYKDLRLKDQQMACAKWRIETYSSLIKLDSMRDRHVADVSTHVAAIINIAVFNLFGDEIKLLANHPRLVKLVTRALDLNHTIKAEVAYAGDIHTGYFPPNHEYDDSRMEVLDAKKGGPLPKYIVSTCGLGVYLTKAVGGGKEPESTVLLKSVVSSEDIYG
ncbi:hypothetical protein FRC06_003425 [Ceratobasidium sp. 370]|nr:hypothetical protein FRC06_003425 [Ceratobasidium sp. 370]